MGWAAKNVERVACLACVSEALQLMMPARHCSAFVLDIPLTSSRQPRIPPPPLRSPLLPPRLPYYPLVFCKVFFARILGPGRKGGKEAPPHVDAHLPPSIGGAVTGRRGSLAHGEGNDVGYDEAHDEVPLGAGDDEDLRRDRLSRLESA